MIKTEKYKYVRGTNELKTREEKRKNESVTYLRDKMHCSDGIKEKRRRKEGNYVCRNGRVGSYRLFALKLMIASKILSILLSKVWTFAPTGIGSLFNQNQNSRLFVAPLRIHWIKSQGQSPDFLLLAKPMRKVQEKLSKGKLSYFLPQIYFFHGFD